MKKHVLIFIPSIESGGVEKNAIIVANGLAAQDYPVSVLYCRMIEEKQHAFSEAVQLVRFDRKTIPYINPRLTDAHFMKKSIKDYLKKQDAQNTVLIAFQSASAVIGVCKRMKVKVICRLSNHPSAVRYEHSMVRSMAERLRPYTYKKADAIIANSQKLAEDFGKKINRSVITVYNPIDEAEIKRKQDEAIEPELKAEAFSCKGRLLVAVGRLTAQKDYDTLLYALKRSTHFDTKLWIIGEGAERAHIEALIQTLELGKRVRLLGYRDNVYKYLKYATIYVLSSRYEGCPNSLIEAVAMGIPCIASDCLTGPREVLLEGEGGLLFPVGSDIRLAESIDFYLNNEKSRKKMQEKAYAGRERFLLSRTLEGYKNLIG